MRPIRENLNNRLGAPIPLRPGNDLVFTGRTSRIRRVAVHDALVSVDGAIRRLRAGGISFASCKSIADTFV